MSNSTVVVDIEIPDGRIMEGVEIPTDYTIQELISEVVDQLGFPRVTEDGNTIQYSLYNASKSIYLSGMQTIKDAGIRAGDAVRLMSSHPIDSSAAETEPESIPPTRTDEIQILLSLLDVGKHETVNLPLDRKIGDVIKLIIQNNDLPARDKLGQLIKYRLRSKALGEILDENKTLRSAGIPTKDNLALLRINEAGGGNYGRA